jgi:hypothetical protein
MSQEPNHPKEPKRKMNKSPAMTGETAKGTSIKVISRFFPGKWNFVIAQASMTPNTVFRGTLIRAASRVSRMDANTSLSERALKYTATPDSKASEKIVIKGKKINTNRKIKDTPMSMGLIQGASRFMAAFLNWFSSF